MKVFPLVLCTVLFASCVTTTNVQPLGPGRVDYNIGQTHVLVMEEMIPGDPSPGNALMSIHHQAGDSLEIFVQGNAHLYFKIHNFRTLGDHALGKDLAHYESYLSTDSIPGNVRVTSIDTVSHRFDAVFHFVGYNALGGIAVIDSGIMTSFPYTDFQ